MRKVPPLLAVFSAAAGLIESTNLSLCLELSNKRTQLESLPFWFKAAATASDICSPACLTGSSAKWA